MSGPARHGRDVGLHPELSQPDHSGVAQGWIVPAWALLVAIDLLGQFAGIHPERAGR